MPAGRYAIGLDLGGTTIFGAVVDGNGRIGASAEQATPVQAGPDAVLEAMEQMIRGLLEQVPGGRPLGIGLGIPGLLDRAAGLSVFSPNLFWHNVPVRPRFEAAFGLPVEMDNDVRCAALGEFHFGSGRGVRDLILLTLGTGIGSGIILDGRLYRGGAGMAGEIGHVALKADGPLCNCGKRGCLEALASGTAIARRAQAAGLPYGTARAVAAAAHAGDGGAIRLLQEVAEDLGLVLAAYINIMNPPRIVLGGGVALSGAVLLDPVRAVAEANTMPGIKGKCEIVTALLGDEAGAVGAAALVPGLAEGAPA